MKKPILAITTADKNNFNYAVMMLNSLRKFHDWPAILVTDEVDPEKLKLLPKDVEVKDLTVYIKNDPHFFYRQKPILMEEYIKDYEVVLGLDSDQIITGSLDYILETKDYDVAGVLNYNALDAQQYGVVQGWGINPIEYVNCGLVAVRSEKFVHEWYVWAFSPQFERMQYKEQDGLNIKIYHGNWNCRILDHGDEPAKMHAVWGLFGKSHWNKAILQDDKLIIPKDEADLIFSKYDTEIKVLHWAGGNGSPEKMQYRTRFSDDIIERIDYLVSDTVK